MVKVSRSPWDRWEFQIGGQKRGCLELPQSWWRPFRKVEGGSDETCCDQCRSKFSKHCSDAWIGRSLGSHA